MLKQKLYWCLFFFSLLGFGQEKVILSGVASDTYNNETLIGVSVYISELNIGTYTNEYGFYSISVPQGNYTVQVSYVGFETILEKIEINQNVKKNFSLKESNQELKEVVITKNIYRTNIKKPEMSVNKLSINTIKQMPAILGETDVIKSILTLPGVTNAGEGQSGFNVRGGSADQNLVLLDEATIYNTSHLFGFFSVFNTDAIKDLKLYKGGIPSRFGGRVASVLEIYQKDGNNTDFHMNGGIGIISSRLLVEGPIVKNKGSFLFAGRSSYAHLFLKLTDNKNSAYFYDLNTKLSYKLNENNNLYASGYFGRDVFSLNESFVNTYGNSVFNLRWNHLFSNKLFSNLSLIYSDYYYGLTLDFIGFNWDSGIKNYNLKYDFKHYLSDKVKLFYGANAIYHDFNPGKIEPTNDTSGINPDQLAKKYAFEPSVYIDVEQQITNKLAINYGLRYSKFYRLGDEEINLYANNQAVVYNEDFQIYEKATPIGSEYFGKNKTIAQFGNLEPRVSIAYTLNESSSIKASYNRMSQYLHLISNTQSPTPLDVWAPSDDYLKPQILDQVAFGYFKNFQNDDYTLEVETFFKKLKNRLDYIDGADLIANDDIEQVVLNGEARAYGLEILARKNNGKLNGWISYTLSRSEQRTPGRTAVETGINNGEWYKTGWDKLHNIAITSMYKLNEKWSFSSIFSLQSGQPVTYPNGQYQYQGISVPTYGLRNENRLPTYHRLDISATLVPEKNKTRNWHGEWVFGIYNVYSRKNAASISFRQNQDSGNNEAVRLSIFGIVPSVTYNFKF
ncbi:MULTISPECIES: TonB-dependent receptor [unclassified Flavobacterium]|uniref:TonB-dependent receptor n=1 Tax=unclassified Flavobacterium TaxID=196869 RepID=UPI00129167C1|nr:MULTISPECIES: TonB-dependent receptor [unclassified Flavobacterium]MQP53565.1 TonB-dependent receptor plug domain-containing protein [Flavobacterium sp. LMO9]MQP63486.1 TonB-dependent receptor plug domain-containing protein [Flavobacterium sp. LMO6]